MTRVKICGITNEKDALFAADRGADFLGFIFAEGSPRNISPDRAAAIARSVRGRASAPKLVGVFRNAPSETVGRVAAEVSLDLVQLHGSETNEDIDLIGVPAIKTLGIGDTLPSASDHPSAAWLLFDTFDDQRGGGTGRRFDWSLLALYEHMKPFFLAGGITPENVGAAISLVRPDAVDVASGVEAEPGIKDFEKLERLFERVRRA